MVPARPSLADPPPQAAPGLSGLLAAWRLRHRRRWLLARAIRARRHLTVIADRSRLIRTGDVLVFATVRNEDQRLPWFLDHYRKLGAAHFLIVENAATDGTRALLRDQPDVSLWATSHSYKRSRFGMDWMNWLLMRHGHGHWCLTVDADELLIYPHWQTRPLPALTEWLDDHGQPALGAMMLDLYPRGALGSQTCRPDQDPTQTLAWFDAGNHVMREQQPLGNLWIQGGVRARRFFGQDPRRAPTLGKVPLVKWHWRQTYVSSTHTLLPPGLNRRHAIDGGEPLSAILLHTKFLAPIVAKSVEEKARREHFANSDLYDGYYDALAGAPDLWCPQSTRYQGWRHLEALGLMSRGGWV